MSDVFTDFKKFWRPETLPTRSGPTEDEVAEIAEQQRAEVADMRTFVATMAYPRYRKLIEHEIALNEPQPQHGSDVSACFTFKQAGLREALRILDRMVQLAEERIDA